MVSVGIDAGSRAIKIVLFDPQNQKILAQKVGDQEIHQAEKAEELLSSLLYSCGYSHADIGYTVATGYGRDFIPGAHESVTEITCHGYGVAFFHPDVKTIIDIGGQDSKVLHILQKGRVKDFSMNDRCAAGTGRFLEVVADRLNIPLSELGTRAGMAKETTQISSMCVVFAETEIVGLMARQTPVENILAGVCSAIALRTAALAGIDCNEPVFFTGGVSRIKGMDHALSRALGLDVEVSQNPQLTGALGAARIAAARIHRNITAE
jgi:predicted CoA-substrate-specific enzyme activase